MLKTILASAIIIVPLSTVAKADLVFDGARDDVGEKISEASTHFLTSFRIFISLLEEWERSDGSLDAEEFLKDAIDSAIESLDSFDEARDLIIGGEQLALSPTDSGMVRLLSQYNIDSPQDGEMFISISKDVVDAYTNSLKSAFEADFSTADGFRPVALRINGDAQRALAVGLALSSMIKN